jgi:predicted nucleotidyltransferase
METAFIREVINTIIAGYQPSKIILFGSYAKGTANASSDVDLLIVKTTDESKYQRASSVRHLFNPQPCAMDILVYTPEEYEHLMQFKSLIPYIATIEGKVVYERGN